MTQRMPYNSLTGLLSRQITRIRRINYVNPNGSRDSARGPVEVSFSGGACVRFESGADGSTLRLRMGEWVDPFAEPLDAENRAFVQSAGKWTAFDVSGEEGYRGMVGHAIGEIDLISFGDLVVGIRITVDLIRLEAVVDADELLVTIIGEQA